MGVDDKVQKLRRGVRKREDGVTAVARIGVASVGISFAVVGVMAGWVAMTGSGETQDRQGAMAQIASHPLGRVLLVGLALGFAGYAVWRLVVFMTGESIEDQDDKGWLSRAAYLARGVFYCGLSLVTLRYVVKGPGNRGAGNEEQQEVATIFEVVPLGRWVVGAVGAGFIAAGLFNVFRAVSGSFEDGWRNDDSGFPSREVLSMLSRYGLGARGVVFGMIGVFLIRAAWQYDPQEAVGLDGALARLAGTPAGPWLLGAAAIGLLAYAVFRFSEAMYRKM